MQPEHLLDHLDFVKGLARHLVLDPDRADDVTQQVFLAALRHPPQRIGVRAWLTKVTRNTAAKQVRSQARRDHRERAVASPLEVPTPQQVLEREEVRRRIVDAVLTLDEPYRATVLLRYFEHRSPAEIAAHLDLPVATVKTRLKRALQRLRAALDREFGERRTWCVAVLPLIGPRPSEAAAMTAAAMQTGALWMTANTKIALAALVLVGASIATWQMTAPAAAEFAIVPAVADGGVPITAAEHTAPVAVPQREPAPSAVTPPAVSEPAAPTAATELPESCYHRLKLVADSFRTQQPDYVTWFALIDDLADHAELVDGSVYRDEHGKTRGRFELPGELYLTFAIDEGKYVIGIKNMATMLDEGSSFTELHAAFGFAVHDTGIDEVNGQILFRDYTYEGLSPQTLGHLWSMDHNHLEMTELTHRANPEEKGSWIYAPGAKWQVPFSEMTAAERWYGILRGLAKRN